jgi:3-phosphoshikimate 1-carboxyvinyltransferase
LACALIANGESYLKNIGISDDEQASLEIIRKAGATVSHIENDVLIQSSGFNPSGALNFNVNESGLATRMFTPILANSSFKVDLTGQGSILTRTMSFFDEILPQLNVEFNSNQGKLPFSLLGPIQPKTIAVDGSISSQYITGLIYSYVASPLLRNDKISIHDLKSEPYLLLTLDVLKLFGVELIYKDKTVYFDGPYTLNPSNISIEGDWSSASFLFVAGAIAGKVSLSGLNPNSKQADIAILEVLKKAGAKVEQDGDWYVISKNELNGFEFDATDCPDLFPPIAVLAGLCKGSSKIKGANRLIHKESNRGIVLQKELKQFGIEITLEDDIMIISPTEKVIDGTIDPHGDHRIAMAGALLGLVSEKGVNILTPHVVNKSFPQFFEVLDKLSAENNP